MSISCGAIIGALAAERQGVEPTFRVVSTAPWMIIRWLAREALPNQRLQRTSAAYTSFAPGRR